MNTADGVEQFQTEYSDTDDLPDKNELMEATLLYMMGTASCTAMSARVES